MGAALLALDRAAPGDVMAAARARAEQAAAVPRDVAAAIGTART